MLFGEALSAADMLLAPLGMELAPDDDVSSAVSVRKGNAEMEST
jgi:hypothetical protein